MERELNASDRSCQHVLMVAHAVAVATHGPGLLIRFKGH